jgi:hypothetical protein
MTCTICTTQPDGGWGPDLTPGYTHCRDCHRSFTRTQHHCVTCHATFRSAGADNLHRRGDTCAGDPRVRDWGDKAPKLKRTETPYGLLWSGAESLPDRVKGLS